MGMSRGVHSAVDCLAAMVLLTLLSAAAAQSPSGPLGPPADSIPDGPLGEAIRLGQKVMSQTRVYARQYAGNALNCASCHLDGGRTPYTAPLVGIWGVFPEYRSRNARVNILEDRINDCFERSMNGRRLPVDSDEMHGLLAYMQWLSKGVPTGQDGPGRGFQRIKSSLPPDPGRGKQVYADKCAACHEPDGQGLYGTQGEMLFPPLWGPLSFNVGAGMARVSTAAAFVKVAMPLGQGGTLTDQEAFDVAMYFTQQPRPDFADKQNDWPRGGKPEDARY
jgi:thiosulfate dehydrogenase